MRERALFVTSTLRNQPNKPDNVSTDWLNVKTDTVDH